MKTRTIGQLAREAGVGVETIRFYEREGLLAQPQKPRGGYRTYPGHYAQRIRFIQKAQSLGFTLREVKELLALNDDTGATCRDVRRHAEAKRLEVEAKIEGLLRMRDQLGAIITACGEGKRALRQCRIVDCVGTEKENCNESTCVYPSK